MGVAFQYSGNEPAYGTTNPNDGSAGIGHCLFYATGAYAVTTAAQTTWNAAIRTTLASSSTGNNVPVATSTAVTTTTVRTKSVYCCVQN